GLYLESLIRGTDFAAGSAGGVTRQRLQQRLEQEGIGPLLAELQTIDPDSAARLHPSDEKRILRALEVWYETGETITQHDRRTRQQPPRYQAAYIGLSFQDRAQLRRRIDLRVDEMVRQGLLEEVQALLAAGLPPTATAWQAIGYKQFLAAADGRCTVTEAIEEVKLRSRQYAKRQLTWLRRNPDIHWILWGEEPNFPQGLQNATEYLTALGLR
ncbi:MAG: tRNA (adenosine(37)-N6)-dimethylallyltransferase MiaA, partial [Oscillospiraceae bacterium]|nr:tRNA (adenosine(37)-N6)-dimethylallyltransferase MiaA [Oscillospiraceae bacterium]